MGLKWSEINKNKVPGPGSYESADLDTIMIKRPVHSMAPKTEIPADKTPKPSPNAYYPKKVRSLLLVVLPKDRVRSNQFI